MNAPNETEIIPQTGFDPILFWQQHKTKVIIYGVIILAVVIGFAGYEFNREHALASARQALSLAKTGNDYRYLIDRYPSTIAAGDASLLLAEQLRDQKKYDDAISVLKAMIDKQPKHPLIDGAWLSLAATYQAEGKSDQAIDTYHQTATKFADRYSAPLAMLSVGDILASEGKLDEAKVAYENVNSQFSQSMFAREALDKLRVLNKK
jgi:TolA-binding protein